MATDAQLRKIAKDRADFKTHLAVYVVVNFMLMAINIWSSPGTLWFLIVAFFWGIGLVFHGLDAYGILNSDQLAEKEYQKLKAAQKKK